MILSGSANQHLAYALAGAIDEPVCPVSYRRFADGELMIEVDEDASLPPGVRVDGDTFTIDDRAVIVCSTTDDRSHLEVLQLQDLAREGGAESVVTVVPYLGYARQDVAHDPGQPVSARAMARALSANTDRVVTVDPHELAVLEYFTADAVAVSAVGALADGLTADGDPLFLAPDEGARDLAVEVHNAVGAGRVDHLTKERIDDTTVEISVNDTDAAGRSVVLVDDEISTGGTVATAARRLMEAGATSVSAACVHPLFVGGAYSRLRAAGVEEVVATDTIERPVSTTSAAEAIAAVL